MNDNAQTVYIDIFVTFDGDRSFTGKETRDHVTTTV